MKKTPVFLLAAALALLAAAGYRYVGAPRVLPAPAPVSVSEVLSAEPEGFNRALEPRPFLFPEDHGAHPDYRNEWWYFTGNLDGPDGRHFGFQFTLFRFALSANQPERGSAWAARQIYMGHLAVSDVAGGRFAAHERLGRGAVGLAGAQTEPLKVWLEDWTLQGGSDAAGPWFTLRAREGGIGIDLRLQSAKPVVLQGDRGLSRKSAEPGNASYYYSLTRLQAEGQLSVAGAAYPVSGQAWLDREWGTSALAADQVGWDWFALQLDDGRELMFYQLRDKQGRAHAYSSGTLVEADGRALALGSEQVQIEVQGHWTSPGDGARYPAGWRVRVPSADLDLRVSPHLADQELKLSVRYWEGAVQVRGEAAGRPLTGRGYVELTGYAGSPAR